MEKILKILKMTLNHKCQRCNFVSSCTTGMQLFYNVLNISSGDEVIVSSQTHVATAHAIELWSKTNLVDSELKTANINIEKIEKKLIEKQRQLLLFIT